ncbi:TPA: serine-rich repeat glycoprotein adhesin SasA, partial [Staphylococcus aureus]|nr:serine-rich repeat glycoprotein adhesin SasA [Staphylococcus aureus]
MSKRQKAFHDSLANEKTRVRLYKSGKNWVKSGIKEIEMFKIMGLPFISHSLVSQDNQSISKKMTGYGLKTTAVIGGAFTVNMLHDQQAFAASDAPLTSELNTQSETVGNQNSTTIEASTSTADSTSVTKNSSSVQTSNSDTVSSEKSEKVTSTTNSTSNQQEKLTSTSESTSSKNTTSSSDTKSVASTSSTEQPINTSTNQSTASNNTSQSTTPSSVNLNKTSTTSTSTAPVKLRTFSRLAMSTFASAATTTAVTANTITVNKDNLKQYMTTSGNATYDQSTGIVTLTQDAYSQKGAITLGTRIDSNKSFHFSGKVNLGNKYEGHGNGGDGIGFAFSPGVLGETGLNGAAVGIGGLSNAFGFKLDTYHNTSKPNSAAKANADPSNVAGGGAFGAFVTTDSYGVATTYTSSSTADNAAKLNVQPTNNTFQDFDINYNGDTKVMTVKYAGQTWTRNISDWIAKSGTTNFSLSMTASTGGATNLQQVQFGTFEYTESAVTQVRYVDVTTGKDIIPPKTYSGNVDQVVTIDNQQSALTAKGYNYTSVDSSYASTYNDTNKTVKMTNAGQSVTYYFTDVKAPTVTVGNQTIEVGKTMNPVVLTTTDNGTGTVTNTVTGLPSGLSYDSATNSIIGTPTKIGQSTVTVVSTDQANNKSTTTFTINVVDTTAPTVTPIGDQSSEVYSPISPIKIATQDNSGNAVTNTVTGLPSGLTFDSTNNTISGTPTNIGTSTISIVSTDASGNKTTTTFKYEVTRNSMSDSVSTSGSTQQSQSVSTSKADSQSASTSTSGSIVVSTSASTSKSTSVSLSDSVSASKSLSTSESNSVSSSTSTSLVNS